MLGYGIATGTVVLHPSKLHIHNAWLHEVVDPIPALNYCHFYVAVLLLCHSPHGFWELSGQVHITGC